MKPYPAFLFLAAASAFAQTPTTATITVTAAGSQPFTFQWNKDGAPIPGATANPLVLTPLSAANAGVYTVQVSNSAGTTLSTPATLDIATITTSGGTAPVDLSKQYAELAMSGSWTPAIAQFPDFVVVPLLKVNDVGNHWDDAGHTYLIGAGEGGVYEILITARSVDQPPPNVSVGLTAGVDNKDNKTLWAVTPNAGGAYVRGGMQAIVRGSYAAGDKIRVNVFTQSALTFVSFNATVRKLY